MNFRPSKHDRADFGKLASQYSLTYYGTVIPENDTDYLPVRGLTASPEQVDDNYCAGSISGIFTEVLQRSHDIIDRTGKTKRLACTIVAVDSPTVLPHLIIAHRGEHNVLAADLISYLRIYEIKPSEFRVSIAEDFANKFAIYSTRSDSEEMGILLQPDLQAMLSVHFAHFDYEFVDKKLYVYSGIPHPKLIDLDHQVRVAIWLAKRIADIDFTAYGHGNPTEIVEE